MCNGSDGTNRANDRSHQSRYEEYTHPPFREQQLGGFGSIGPARVGDSVEQHVALVHYSGGGPQRGVPHNVGGRCCVRNRYTGRGAVNTPLRDWLS